MRRGKSIPLKTQGKTVQTQSYDSDKAMKAVKANQERKKSKSRSSVSQSYKPPQAVRSAAARGLELRRKHKRGGLTAKEASKEGIGSGVQRAVNLKNGSSISYETIKRMVNFFNRHSAYKHKHREEPTGPARISWLLWGGDAGRRWAESIVRRHERAKKA